MTRHGPTFGHPAGEHRVVEPPGAVTVDAARLDANPELWDGELRLELESLVLRPAAHRRWCEQLHPDPEVLRAAFAEVVAERGGVGPEAADATVVGRIAAVGNAHPHPVEVGQRVAVGVPAGALPLLGAPTDAWGGSRVVPVAGHAVVPAVAATVPVGAAPPGLAALLADLADVPAGLAPGPRTLLLGCDRGAGAVVLAAAVAQHRTVTAVVRSLGAARLARAAGADTVVIADLGDPVGAADDVTAATAGARFDLAVVADPEAAALAVRVAPAVQVLTPRAAAAATVAEVLRHAAATGRGPAVHAGRAVTVDRGAALRELIASSEVLGATLRWQAGVGALPTVGPGGGDDRWREDG